MHNSRQARWAVGRSHVILLFPQAALSAARGYISQSDWELSGARPSIRSCILPLQHVGVLVWWLMQSQIWGRRLLTPFACPRVGCSPLPLCFIALKISKYQGTGLLLPSSPCAKHKPCYNIVLLFRYNYGNMGFWFLWSLVLLIVAAILFTYITLLLVSNAPCKLTKIYSPKR